MAFPTVANIANATTTSNGTTQNGTYPTGIVSGNLLLGIMAIDGTSGSGTWPSGWSTFTGSGSLSSSANTLVLRRKFADGSESGNFSITGTASEQSSVYVLRIAGAHGSTEPEYLSYASADANPDGWSGVGANSLNPSGWDVEDTLWLSCVSVDTSRTITSYPTNCADNRNSSPSGGSNGATAAFASTTSAASSFDPDPWTISASDDWVTAIIAVRPVGAKARLPFAQPRRFFRR